MARADTFDRHAGTILPPLQYTSPLYNPSHAPLGHDLSFSTALHASELNRDSHSAFVTPRTVSFSGLPGHYHQSALPSLGLSSAGRMLSSFAESPLHSPRHHQFPWPIQRDLVENDLTCNGSPVKPTILARMDKGFSHINNHWTCYRRNYFEVTAAYHLDPLCHGAQIKLRGKVVQAFGVGIAACVQDNDLPLDGQRSVDILQFTPKRDNSARRELKIVRLWPGLPLNMMNPAHHRQYYHGHGRPPALVPMLKLQDPQNREEASHPSSSNRYSSDSLPLVDHAGDGLYKQHTFDRLQFRTATANNGKRRASQQFYRLKLQLFADIRNDGSPKPHWVKIGELLSDELVVRGRSPNHYKDEDKTKDANEGEPAGRRSGNADSTSGGSTYNQTFGFNNGYSSSEDGRSNKTNIGGFRGYCSSAHEFGYAALDSPESSLTSPDTMNLHYDQYGDDVKHELLDESRLTEVPGYTLSPGPLLSPDDSTLKGERSFPDDPTRSAFRAEFPRSMQTMRWHYEEVGERDSNRAPFNSNHGLLPLNFLDTQPEHVELFQSKSLPDSAHVLTPTRPGLD